MSFRVKPAWSSSLLVANAGPMPMRRGSQPAVAFERIGVLFLPGDAPVLDQHFRGLTHDESRDWVGEAQLDRRYRAEMPRTEAQHRLQPLPPALGLRECEESGGGVFVEQQR